jgi:hypothetical protein
MSRLDRLKRLIREKNPIYMRYAQQEAAGHLAMLLASRCHLAGLKFGVDADMDRIIGAIRHDVPVDAIATLLTKIAHEKCACDVEDGEIDHNYDCRVAICQSIIRALQEGPASARL